MDGKDGVWIGIDLGTSNCACAVWDSARGRPKVLQLKGIARPRGGKDGRIVPSAVLYRQPPPLSHPKAVVVGYPATQVQQQQQQETNDDDNENAAELSTGALVTSVKRLVVANGGQLDQSLLRSLPIEVETDDDDGSVVIKVYPLETKGEAVRVTPQDVLAELLRSIRLGADLYLKTVGRKKGLRVPGGGGGGSSVDHIGDVTNCVVGVPAHFGRAQRDTVVRACRRAGFVQGHVSTVVESTAAALAYGLFVSVPTVKHVMVLDMGGGTTDVTVVQLLPTTNHNNNNNDTRGEEEEEGGNHNSNSRVLCTRGDARLGGNDMDEAILGFVLQQTEKANHNNLTTKPERRLLLEQCRLAKESLCGDGDGPPLEEEVSIRYKDKTVTLNQNQFNETIQPLLDRLTSLVESVCRDANETKNDDDDNNNNKSNKSMDVVVVDEVVLVGGATRVPAVRETMRRILKSKHPKEEEMELCVSLNAETAVAQGAAIQAAIRSGLVPLAELRNAMMLDALPHTLGVLLLPEKQQQQDNDNNNKNESSRGEEQYMAILHKDQTLPAVGHATFALADARQQGVTVVAVEDVGNGLPLERVGEFNFLLRRLSPERLERLDGGKRTVRIGFTMETSGQLMVSLFDENDPEHVRKKLRYQQEQEQQKSGGPANKGLDKDEKQALEEEEGLPLWLLVGCIVLLVLYVGAKVAFNDPLSETDIP